jgi:hypothetical protein
MGRWFAAAGLADQPVRSLPPTAEKGLTVKIWTGQRAAQAARSAA